MNSSRKFRVAVKERGEWIVHDPPHHFYLSPGGGLVRATDKGVRMYAGEHEATFYTGLTDAEGTEVYEGDILDWRGKERFRVVFENGSFVFETDAIPAELVPEMIRESKIVGNVPQNPDLLRQTN